MGGDSFLLSTFLGLALVYASTEQGMQERVHKAALCATHALIHPQHTAKRVARKLLFRHTKINKIQALAKSTICTCVFVYVVLIYQKWEDNCTNRIKPNSNLQYKHYVIFDCLYS